MQCDWVGVKLVETQDELLGLADIEDEGVGVNERDSVPLPLPLVVALCDEVAHTLCVALPH